MKKQIGKLVLTVLVVAGMAAWAGAQELTNGTFDGGLAPWTAEPTGTDAVVHYADTAVLLLPEDFPLIPGSPFMDNSFAFLSQYPYPAGFGVAASTLSQTFTLPANVDTISFDMCMEVYTVQLDGGETDTLTATLYYGPGFSQSKVLYNLTSTDVKFNVLEYVVDEEVNQEFDGFFINIRHCIYHTSVTRDISQMAGQEVKLVFELSHDPFDDTFTTVTLDDVAIATAGDTTPPAVEVGELLELWPPNHKYRVFNLSDCVASVGDDTDGQINIDDVGNILQISSDEPEDIKGNGDGKSTNDMVILSHSSFMVRTERQGANNGRVYAVTFDVADSAGNITVATLYLGVPHDKRGDLPVDDGAAAGYTVYP